MRSQMDTSKAQIQGVLHDVDEGDYARPALGRVEPVAGPRVIRDVALASIPDVKAVEAVVEDRNPDEEQLQQKNAGQAVEELDLFPVGYGAVEGFGVRDEVLDQEGTDGYDAAERMK